MGQKLEGPQLELYRRVDEILHYVWDPIGIAGEPGARDEYDDYLARVFSMLHEGATADGIRDYLIEVAQDRMGLTPSDESKKRAELAAAKIMKWRTCLAGSSGEKT